MMRSMKLYDHLDCAKLLSAEFKLFVMSWKDFENSACGQIAY